MSAEAFVPDDLEEPEEPEEPGGSEGNPGNESDVLPRIEALQREVRELQEAANSEAPEPLESILDSDSFRELVRAANAETLAKVIEETPGLDDGVREALRLTLDQMRHESAPGDDDEPEPELSEGERCLELRSRIRTLDEELEGLDGDRGAFTEAGEQKRAQDRKLIALLEAEREKAAEELNKILAVPDAEPEEDPDDRWSR